MSPTRSICWLLAAGGYRLRQKVGISTERGGGDLVFSEISPESEPGLAPLVWRAIRGERKYIYINIYIHMHMYVSHTVYLSVFLFFYLCICLPVYLPVRLCVCLTVCVCLCLPMRLSFCLSMCLPILSPPYRSDGRPRWGSLLERNVLRLWGRGWKGEGEIGDMVSG
jgi:hypothetical protein